MKDTIETSEVSSDTSFKEVSGVQVTLHTAGTALDPVEDIKQQIDSLRTSTDEIDKRFYAPGRAAVAEAVSKAYAVYKAVMDSPERETLMKYIRNRLYVLDKYEPTANAKETSLFLRFVFKFLDEKQRCLYGRALIVAHTLNVEPDGFAAWVKTKGGFEAIRADSAATGGVKEPHSGVAAQQSIIADVKHEEEFDETTADDPVYVLLALRNEDGTYTVKESRFDEDATVSVLKLFDRQRQKRLKAVADGKAPAKKRALTQTERLMKLNARGDVHNAEMVRDDLKIQLAKAETGRRYAEVETLRIKLLEANAALEAAIAKKKFISEAL